MKRTIFLLTFFLVISVLINLSFIFDKIKTEEDLFKNEKTTEEKIFISECTICKLFIRDLNSHWFAQNGLSKEEIVILLEHYPKSLPPELEKVAANLIENNKQILLGQIISGKPPFKNVCKTLLGCD